MVSFAIKQTNKQVVPILAEKKMGVDDNTFDEEPEYCSGCETSTDTNHSYNKYCCFVDKNSSRNGKVVEVNVPKKCVSPTKKFVVENNTLDDEPGYCPGCEAGIDTKHSYDKHCYFTDCSVCCLCECSC